MIYAEDVEGMMKYILEVEEQNCLKIHTNDKEFCIIFKRMLNYTA